MPQDTFRRDGTGKFIVVPSQSEPVPPPACQPTATEQKARKLYEQALDDLQRKALGNAETALRLSVSFNPNDDDARNLLERVKVKRDAERRAHANLKIGG
jgi:hypothetical protein